jgi:arylsulfatase A
VIFTSDNGAKLRPTGITSNLPLSHGKASVFEGGIRVPMIVAGPGIAAGTRSSVTVSGMDFLPTIAAWAGYDGELAAGVEGGNMLPLLLGKSDHVVRPREELVHHFPHYLTQHGTTPQSSLRSGDYKLIKFWESGQSRLFDLGKDIGETQDLAASMPERTAELEQRLVRYLKEIDARLPTANPEHAPH